MFKKKVKMSAEDEAKIKAHISSFIGKIKEAMKKPAVQIDEEVLKVNGEDTEKTYRISIAERDNILLTEAEYDALVEEIFVKIEPHYLTHLIWSAHNRAHVNTIKSFNLDSMFNGKGLSDDVTEKK